MKPVNLNQARKSRARLEAKKAADANAVKFGRTKAEKAADKIETAKTIRTLDGAKRDR